MAVLTPEILAQIRREFTVGLNPTWNKTEVNAVLQAVEDWFEANRTSLGAAMEAAAPGKFNAAMKKRLAAYWLLNKYGREL